MTATELEPAVDEFRLTKIRGIVWKIAAGWSLVAVNAWSEYVVVLSGLQREVRYEELAIYVALRAAGWMGLTWGLFLFLDHQPPGRMRFREVLLRVAPMLVIASLLEITYNAGVSILSGAWPPMSFRRAFEGLLWRDFHQAILWMFIIIAVGHGIRFHYIRAETRLRESQLQTALMHSRLETLNSRLQPHFLFNALNSISALITTDTAAAERTVSRLGDLLRAVMSGGKSDMISLHDELRFVGQFLEIQQLRFADRMTVSIHCAPDAANLMVPRFVLQPLVENAVRHGVEHLDDPGTVTIDARIEDVRLVLRVDNSAPRDLPWPPSREGIGLSNTRARLNLLFPERHEFRIVKRDDRVIATVNLPIVRFRQSGAMRRTA